MKSVDQKKPFTENSTTKGQKFMVFLNILWISDQIPGQSNPQVPLLSLSSYLIIPVQNPTKIRGWNFQISSQIYLIFPFKTLTYETRN